MIRQVSSTATEYMLNPPKSLTALVRKTSGLASSSFLMLTCPGFTRFFFFSDPVADMDKDKRQYIHNNQ